MSRRRPASGVRQRRAGEQAFGVIARHVRVFVGVEEEQRAGRRSEPGMEAERIGHDRVAAVPDHEFD